MKPRRDEEKTVPDWCVSTPRVTVISTGYKVPYAMQKRCVESVWAQKGVDVDHIYIDSDVDVTQIEHYVSEIGYCGRERIVALVDGDDYLARPDALEIVAKAHAAGAWVTYGSYRHESGRPGCAKPYQPHEWDDIRRAAWKASHLKTFRAGLFQKIRPEDLQIDGRWIDRAVDHAVMFPLLEMAGPERTCYIPEVLYVYDYEASFERFASRPELLHERDIALQIRAKPVYPRILAGNGFMP